MTLDQFKQTYEDWKLSGLSVRDYCNNTGFDEGKFYYWRRKLTDSALPGYTRICSCKNEQSER